MVKRPEITTCNLTEDVHSRTYQLTPNTQNNCAVNSHVLHWLHETVGKYILMQMRWIGSWVCTWNNGKIFSPVTVLAKTPGWRKTETLLFCSIVPCHCFAFNSLIYLFYCFFYQLSWAIGLFEVLQKFRDFKTQWAIEEKTEKNIACCHKIQMYYCCFLGNICILHEGVPEALSLSWNPADFLLKHKRSVGF